MTTKHPIATTADLMKLFGWLKVQQLPITVAVKDGVDRSLAQNRLVNKWYSEAANWLGDQEAWEVRSECKLYLGVRLMLAEDETFREKWYRMIKDRYTLEEKLEMMSPPWDFPVTRLMTVKQMTKYMDAVHQKYAAQGVPLSLPDDRKYADMGERQ